MPPEELVGLRKKQLEEVRVCGVAYAPALHVRQWDRVENRKGYLFHSKFNEADGDTALFGKCPEVVRVDNCTAWRPMSDVMDAVPRVVHPDDMDVMSDVCILFRFGVSGVPVGGFRRETHH